MAMLVIRGLKSAYLMTRGFASGAPVVADHRTLYAQAAQRKPSAAIDPTKTIATRK